MFQFTHPGGVRQYNKRLSIEQELFQFTHPGGVRLLGFGCRVSPSRFQFTHPGGVRPRKDDDRALGQSFNSRTREGCDLQQQQPMVEAGEFQFTHPGGVRPDKERILNRLQRVSIHAPGRGATCYYDKYWVCRRWFQFTHPGGVRLDASVSRRPRGR